MKNKQLILTTLSRALCTYLFFAILLRIIINYFGFSKSLIGSETTPIFFLFLIFFILSFLPQKISRSQRRHFILFFYSLSLTLFFPFYFIDEAFGDTKLTSILVTFTQMRFRDLLGIGVKDFLNQFIYSSLMFVLLIASANYLISRLRFFKYILILTTLFFIAKNPLIDHMILPAKESSSYISIGNNIEDIFHKVKLKKSPVIKKNIIHIYLESIERSYSNLPSTMDSFSYFSKLENQGLSFTNIGQVYGTEYTGAGLVASQCGVPLLPNGIFNIRKKLRLGVDKDFNSENFMSHITCLGDILSSDGYHLEYLNGSDTNIFSKGRIFLSHGYNSVFGINYIDEPDAEKRKNVWGLNDDFIFEKVESRLESLAKKDKPFVLTMLTIGTHGPDGFLDDECNNYTIRGSHIPAAIECTGNHIKNLIKKLHEIGIAEETIVIIQSDHLAMKNTIYDELKLFGDDRRRNFVTVIDSEKKTKKINKLGSSVDIFPTILEILGYKLDENTANLGVSLLSNKKTLAEELSLSELSLVFENSARLQRLLWVSNESDKVK